MGKRQCEVEVDDSGSLDEITNSQGPKRRKTSPKDDTVSSGKGEVQKEDKDPWGDSKIQDGLFEKEGGKPLKAATEKSPAPCDFVATCAEGGGGKPPARMKRSRKNDVPAAPPVDDDQAPTTKGSTSTEKDDSTEVPLDSQRSSSRIAAANTQKGGPGSKTSVASQLEGVPPTASLKPSQAVKARPRFYGVTLQDLCRNVLMSPDDLAWEIFGWLPALYLLALKGAGNRLGALLNDESPWQKSRMGMYDAPSPPAGAKEWDWARALWGNKCDLCGSRSDSQEGVDFYVARRHCKNCKWLDTPRVIAFPCAELEKHYPDRPTELFEYVYHSPLQTLYPLKNPNLKQFWHVDVCSAIKTWEKHEGDIEAGKEDAVEEFEKWKRKRKQEIASRKEMVKTYETWKEKVTKMNQDTRVEHLKSRLRDLGFKQVDIDAAITIESLAEIRSPPVFLFKGSPSVTNADWKKFRYLLEPLVEAEQAPRLRPHLSGALSEQYLKHVLTHPPSQFGAYPPLKAFAGSAALAYLLPDDPIRKSTSSSQDLSPFLKELPKLVDRYWESKKHWLKQKLLELSPGGKGYGRAHELAKHIFVCPDYPSTATGRGKGLTVCFGWRSAVRHACLGEWDELAAGTRPPGLAQNYACHRPRRDNVLSSHAYELIKMVGEDPEKATVARMDEVDPYYVCETGVGGCRVYSWRGAIRHLLEDRNATSSPSPKTVAARARTAAASTREEASMWSCNHCFSNGGDLKTDTRAGIMKHLRTGHKISSPKVGKNYFLNQDLLHLCEGGYEERSGSAENTISR